MSAQLQISESRINWALVDRQIERAREQLSFAQHEEEFQAIGLHCREALISLAQAVYVPQEHPTEDGVQPSPTDAKRMLDAYVAVAFAGPGNEAARAHAKSALALANSLQHSRTADHRRAAMCVEATTSVINVIAIAAGRGTSQTTVAELCERFINTRSPGTTHKYALQLIAKSPIGGKIASKLQTSDIISHCQQRRDQGISPATVNQDVSVLRSLLKVAAEEWNIDVPLDAVEEAKRTVDKLQLIRRSTPRTRRPSRDEINRLVTYFIEQDRRSDIPMREIMEFALWSGLRISEICRIRWEDVKPDRKCTIRNIKSPRGKKTRDHEFTLLGEAWTIVQRQPRIKDRVFPYNSKSASIRYTRAKAALGIENLRFSDLRREAAKRLHEAGYTIDAIANATGRLELNSLRRDILGAQSKSESSSQAT